MPIERVTGLWPHTGSGSVIGYQSYAYTQGEPSEPPLLAIEDGLAEAAEALILAPENRAISGEGLTHAD